MDDFGFVAGREFRSRTHWGGGGGIGAVCWPVAIFADVQSSQRVGMEVMLELFESHNSAEVYGGAHVPDPHQLLAPFRTEKVPLTSSAIDQHSISAIFKLPSLAPSLLKWV